MRHNMILYSSFLFSLPNANTSAASCYYCIVKSSSDNLGFNHVTNDGQTSTDDPECQEYVICFISFHESSLDLYPFFHLGYRN